MKCTCPVCKQQLTREERRVVCPNEHSFDYAKSGYLNLLISQKGIHGDNVEMVKARTAFLNTDSYAFLKNALHEISEELQPACTIDLGCGEGYYTNSLAGKEKYGFDLSKDTLKHAAKQDPSTQYILSSIFHLPLPDSCADLAVTCFAPAAVEELQRVLTDGGYFLFITPGPHHLYEMKQILYTTPYENEIKELDTTLTKVREELICSHFHADQQTLLDLFSMTPYAYKTGKEGIEKLKARESCDITAEFVIRLYQKSGSK